MLARNQPHESFDALARGLAEGTLSRKRALMVIGAALVGMFNIPEAREKRKRRHHKKSRVRVVGVSPPCGSTAECPQGTTCINGSCCEFAKACGFGKSATCCLDGQLCCNDTCIEQLRFLLKHVQPPRRASVPVLL